MHFWRPVRVSLPNFTPRPKVPDYFYQLNLINPQTRSFWVSPSLSAKQDFYAILGVTRKATTEQLKAAFHQKAVKHHPDKHKGDKKQEEIFKQITEARTHLTNNHS